MSASTQWPLKLLRIISREELEMRCEWALICEANQRRHKTLLVNDKIWSRPPTRPPGCQLWIPWIQNIFKHLSVSLILSSESFNQENWSRGERSASVRLLCRCRYSGEPSQMSQSISFSIFQWKLPKVHSKSCKQSKFSDTISQGQSAYWFEQHLNVSR
jgi:hypothetical protein